MKKFIKILSAFLVGIGIGNFISIIVGLIIGNYSPVVPDFLAKQQSLLIAVIKANMAYGFLGVIGYVSGLLYDKISYQDENPKVNLFFITFLNLSINLLAIAICGTYLNWFNVSYIAFPIFLIIYFIIWTFNYFQYKKDVNLINKKLENK